MEENEVTKKIEPRPPRRSRAPKTRRRYLPEVKRKAVGLHLEEGFSRSLVCQELGISKSILGVWLQKYRLAGGAGLQPTPRAERPPKLPPRFGGRGQTAGYPERFAQEALGHNSKAVHRAYARRASVRIPPLEAYE